VGFTGILCMLFLVLLRMFPEKFSFGICFAPSESNALRLIRAVTSLQIDIA